MIDVATDCDVPAPSDFSKMHNWQLEMFASKGTPEQKDALIDWGYSGCPAWQFEHLYFLATGNEWNEED
jgi:hypothetical protein